MPRINEQVNQTLTAVGSSTVYKYRKRKGHDIIRYSIKAAGGGAFTTESKLEVSDPDAGDWVDVPDAAFTAETSGTFVPGGDCDIRWTITADNGDAIVRIG